MIIYLVMECGGDYESTYSAPIKAFASKVKADLFALTRQVELERANGLRDEYRKEQLRWIDEHPRPGYADPRINKDPEQHRQNHINWTQAMADHMNTWLVIKRVDSSMFDSYGATDSYHEVVEIEFEDFE